MPVQARPRIAIALVALVVWAAITVWGAWRPHAPVAVAEGVAAGIAWRIIAAGAFVTALALVMRWGDLGVALPRPGSLRAFRLPALYLLLFLLIALILGLPPGPVLAVLAINTLAVGISEELMFRGILYRALATRWRLWPAVAMTSIAFGAVHLLNALTTGNLTTAALQAVTAILSGVFLMAAALSTRSIVPGMLYHAAWDLLLAVMVVGAPKPAAAPIPGASLGVAALLVPLAFVLPLFIHGLVLLRRVAREGDPRTAADPG